MADARVPGLGTPSRTARNSGWGETFSDDRGRERMVERKKFSHAGVATTMASCLMVKDPFRIRVQPGNRTVFTGFPAWLIMAPSAGTILIGGHCHCHQR